MECIMYGYVDSGVSCIGLQALAISLHQRTLFLLSLSLGDQVMNMI